MVDKVNVCVDFDGVLNNYTYYDEDDLFTPRRGALEFINRLNEKYNVIILTSRTVDKVESWLNEYGFKVNKVTNIKVPAICYIDDRGLKFNGDYNEICDCLDNFKTYWEEKTTIKFPNGSHVKLSDIGDSKNSLINDLMVQVNFMNDENKLLQTELDSIHNIIGLLIGEYTGQIREYNVSEDYIKEAENKREALFELNRRILKW